MIDETVSPPLAAGTGWALGRIFLSGQWTLAHALAIADQLRAIPDGTTVVDATGIDRLDSAGVMQLMRFAQRRRLDSEHLCFSDEHAALVQVIEDVSDDRPRRRRDYGFAAALERLGRATHVVVRNVVGLVGFTGENLTKLVRTAREPRRFRLTATVSHMEQVGLDAVPLVALLSYLVGAVIAFLGSTILRDFGAEIYVVELVSIAFLREFAVLLTAIVLAGRTASAFTAQIGAMKAREEIDAIRTLGLDPVDLLVIPRLLALVVMLPLLTFVAMMAGTYRRHYRRRVRPGHPAADVPVADARNDRSAALPGRPVQGTGVRDDHRPDRLPGRTAGGRHRAVGRRTHHFERGADHLLVIILDALAALWFMHMDW